MKKNLVVASLACLLLMFNILEVNSIRPASLASLTGAGFGRGIGAPLYRLRCTAPPYPEHGKWKLAGGNAKPGDKIEESSAIAFQCNPGYKLSTKAKYLFCDEDWEDWEIPECEMVCPPLYDSTIYELKCTDKRGKPVKCSEAPNGAFVDYNCSPFYETPFGYKKTFLCQNGKWTQKPVCQPVCGRKITDDAKTLIYGSQPNDKLEYPWVVALYMKSGDSYEHACGGSILSATVVLTAAHCVTNGYGDVFSEKNYLVGAGKLYRKYQAPEDTHAQYLQVSKIIVPGDYKANFRRYLADIAVLVTDGEFKINEVIQPICFNNLKDVLLHAGNIGEVSGWGLSEGEVVSDVLRTLKIPYKYETTCAQELPSEWNDKYNLADKICTGFVGRNTSVCDGDSGGGIAFKNSDDNRYYIHGLISLAVRKDHHCDIQQNTLYTRVAHYYPFVENLLTQYNPKPKDCKLPPFPENGWWTTENEGIKAEDIVPSSTVLTVKCNKGFKPSSSEVNIECGSPHYMPTCQKVCPTPDFPKGTFYQCKSKEGQAVDCSETIDGSKLSYICPALYQRHPGTIQETSCDRGSWEPSQPECVRPTTGCGKATRNGLEFPWTAGIYTLEKGTEESYEYKCGASIISNFAVLTAAQCVTDAFGNVLPKANYLVGIGKIHAKYNVSTDVQAEYKEVSHIVIHPQYNSEPLHVANVAMVLLKYGLTPNDHVQPVCLANILDKMLSSGEGGVISGLRLEESNFKEPEALAVSFIGHDMCRAPSSSTEMPSVVPDKMCVGFTNESNCMHPSDAGKGFYLKNSKDGRYYVYGVVTVPLATEEGCTKQVLLTETSSYYDFFDCTLFRF